MGDHLEDFHWIGTNAYPYLRRHVSDAKQLTLAMVQRSLRDYLSYTTMNQLCPLEGSAARRLADEALQSTIVDSCHCPCTLNGLSLFSRCLKMMSWNIYIDDLSSTLSGLFDTIEHLKVKMGAEHHRIAIRKLTFELLELRHTCVC